MTSGGLIAEWRAPTSHAIGYAVGGVILCALAFVVQVSGENKGPAWLMLAIGLLFAVTSIGAVTNVLTQRVRLFDDRIENAGLGGGRTLLRRDILGRRREHDGDFRLVHRDSAGKGITLPQRVMKTPAFLTWLETLDDLDAADRLKEHSQLEADATLGATIQARRDFLVGIRRACGIASLVGVAITFWAIFVPRPFDIVAGLCVVAPLAAIVICFRWRAAVSLIGGGENEPTAGLFGLWFCPALAVALMGLAVQQVDWRTPLIVAAPLSLLFLAASLAADPRLRNDVGGVTFAMVVAFSWTWGTMVIANTRFDHGSPVLVSAGVMSRSGGETGKPKLTLTSPALPHPVKSLGVSSQRFKASPVGATVCLRVFPGAFGWRYLFIVDCPPNTLVPPLNRDTH